MSVRLSDVTSSLPIKTGHIFIGLGLLMAMVTAVLVQGTILKKADAPKPKALTQEIAVAVSTLPAGATITRDDIKLAPWPVDYMPQGSIFTDIGTIIGRVVKTDLLPGEPVYKEKLSGDRSSGGLPVMIPAGMRAVSVAVSEIKGVAGFVKPGDKVDVLATFEEKDDNDEDIKITKTVLQNVLVLASAQQMVRDTVAQVEKPAGVSDNVDLPETSDKKKNKEKAKEKTPQQLEKEKKERDKERKEAEKRAKLVSSITLALTPDQSEKLALAEEDGEIRMVLRPEGDSQIEDLSGITNHELLTSGPAPAGGKWPFKFAHPGKPKEAPPAAALAPAFLPPPPPGNTVEFIEGTEKSNLEF